MICCLSMNTRPFRLSFIPLLLMGLLLYGSALAEELKTTNVRVTAHEYYDYYGLPDTDKWKKVRHVKIEGQNRAGGIQASQSGPSNVLDVVLNDVAVNSTYYVTIIWQGGERYYQSFTAPAQRDTVHQIYQPY